MSETQSTESTAVADPEPLFENAELRQFEADDTEAGRAIGKMLSILFIYTVIAMSLVALWTVCSNTTEQANAMKAFDDGGH